MVIDCHWLRWFSFNWMDISLRNNLHDTFIPNFLTLIHCLLSRVILCVGVRAKKQSMLKKNKVRGKQANGFFKLRKKMWESYLTRDSSFLFFGYLDLRST